MDSFHVFTPSIYEFRGFLPAEFHEFLLQIPQVIQLVHDDGPRPQVYGFPALLSDLANGSRPLILGQRRQDSQQHFAAEFEISQQFGKIEQIKPQ